jgi:hypothetical protein
MLENENECRAWLDAMFVDVSHHMMMPRVLELDAALGALDAEARAAFRVQQRLMLAVDSTSYKLRKDQLARADKLIARGRKTPYGEELQRRSIDSDAILTWQINNYARPNSSEIL